MAEIPNNKPDLIQAFDFFVDREYYKIIPHFLFSSNRKVRTDRVKDEVVWSVNCDHMPDTIWVNGSRHKLVPVFPPDNSFEMEGKEI